MDDCIFCSIVNGKIPSFKVWEDEDFLSFLSIQPMKEGHSLVIPKKHRDYIFDLEDEELGNLVKSSKKVARILKKTFTPKTGKIGVLVYGLDVPHAHIHLSPIDQPGDLTLAKAKMASQEELKKAHQKIVDNLHLNP